MRRCRPFDSSLQNTLGVDLNCTPGTRCTRRSPQSTAPCAPKFHVLSRLGRASGDPGRVPRDTSPPWIPRMLGIDTDPFIPTRRQQSTNGRPFRCFCVALTSAVGCSFHVRRLITHCLAAFIGCHPACRIKCVSIPDQLASHKMHEHNMGYRCVSMCWLE